MNEETSQQETVLEEFSVIEKRVNDYLKRHPQVADAFLSTFSLLLLREERFPLFEILKSLGLRRFSLLCNLLAGKTVRFPQKDELRASLLWALAYYLKEVRGLSWEDVETELGVAGLPALRFGIRNRYMSSFLQQQMKKILESAVENSKEEGSGE